MKKIGLSILGAFILLAFCFYLIYSFDLFPIENQKIVTISLLNKPYKITLIFIPSNATNRNYIQVRKTYTTSEEVIKNYENYNFVNNYRIKGDTILEMAISDTSQTGVPDTFLLRLPSK